MIPPPRQGVRAFAPDAATAGAAGGAPGAAGGEMGPRGVCFQHARLVTQRHRTDGDWSAVPKNMDVRYVRPLVLVYWDLTCSSPPVRPRGADFEIQRIPGTTRRLVRGLGWLVGISRLSRRLGHTHPTKKEMDIGA